MDVLGLTDRSVKGLCNSSYKSLIGFCGAVLSKISCYLNFFVDVENFHFSWFLVEGPNFKFYSV